jgi:hypothetical protein
MLSDPVGRVEVEHVAELLDTDPVPIVDEPFINVTVPVLMPDGVRVAVSVTGEP